MTSPAGTGHDVDLEDVSATYDPEADESFFTAADELREEQAEDEPGEDLSSEIARVEAQEDDSQGSEVGSDAGVEAPGLILDEDDRDEALDLQEPDISVEQVEVTSDSTIDQGPSLPGSPLSVSVGSHPGSPASRPASGLSIRSRQAGSPQPFEKRFHARKVSGLANLRSFSPGFLSAHSRQASSSSQVTVASSEPDPEEQKPWEIVKWTKLKKLSSQAFSEAGRRAFGNRTYLIVSASIIIGTTKGFIMVFDYQQNLKAIIGQGTSASECGSITSLAVSADHSTIAAGHANGFVFTWDIASPAKPFLMIPSIPRENLANRSTEGHVSNQAVLHVGFLGTRHTALVSADDSGMAFSHLATRGLGAVARSVKSTRILGRYPSPKPPVNMTQKPTSVLACAPLPLGDVEQPTDELGLTALLTPYLLVVVSTTPIAQTHFKTQRPKAVDLHSPMTGCLAWFPAVKLKGSAMEDSDAVTGTKLVYCWSSVLQILELEAEGRLIDQDPRRPNVRFKNQRMWKSEEAIVGVQWISRSVLAVLTITQRLVVLDDHKLEVSDSADLNPRHIFHRDLFSQQLDPYAGKIADDDETLRGVVPDAYNMSFKAYRGRLFLLAVSDVMMGTLSNWADRLVALMESGRVTQAVNLATSYYAGTTEKSTVGLPEDDKDRKPLVGARILQIIRGSLDYLFRKEEVDELGTDIKTALQQLVEPIFRACIITDSKEFLLEDVYEQYSNASCQDVFLYALEPRIMDEEIRTVPADVLKDLVNWFSSHDFGGRLEAMICALDTESLDLDQVTALCKAYSLYDALIYVWNQAIAEFVTPLDDLLVLASKFEAGQESEEDLGDDYESAMKIFPYLAYSLTGREYPSGADMAQESAQEAKRQLYGGLFAESNDRQYRDRHTNEVRYARLTTLLRLNSFEFMSMLNEVFEDSYLNDAPDRRSSGDATRSSVNREHIIKVLRDVLNTPTFGPGDRVYLDIFIARNMPKFPQYIKIPGVALQRILEELCDPPRDDLVEECQLSVEYLLSIYRPSDIQSLIPLFQRAGFYRILKMTYKSLKQYPQWLHTHFDDVNQPEAVFDCMKDCLKENGGLTQRQVKEVKALITEHFGHVVTIDTVRTALILQEYAPDLLDSTFSRLDEEPMTQYEFLKGLFDAQYKVKDDDGTKSPFVTDHLELYIQLMCKYNPKEVPNFVNNIKSGDVRLDQVLPVMESTGIIDAAIVLLTNDGLIEEAFTRLITHLRTLRTALVGLLDREDQSEEMRPRETVDEVVASIQKYVNMGIWLCQGSRSSPHTSSQRRLQISEMVEANLTPEEKRWLELVEAVTEISQAVTLSSQSSTHGDDESNEDYSSSIVSHGHDQHADEAIKALVQDCFTALLATTATSVPSPAPLPKSKSSTVLSLVPKSAVPEDDSTAQAVRLLPILNVFLTRLTAINSTTTSSGTTGNPSETVLPILSSIFAAHTFEHSLLQLATALLDKDVFISVADADARRRRGWRPQGRACSACGLRAWGIGAGVGVWDDWAERKQLGGRGKKAAEEPRSDANVSRARDKGKGRLVEANAGESSVGTGDEKVQARALVVFACGHLFHRGCLIDGLRSQGRWEGAKGEGVESKNAEKREGFVCLLCH